MNEKHTEYWKKRAIANENRTEAQRQQAVIKLEKSFVNCQEKIEQLINDFYYKYALDGVIPPGAEKQRLTFSELQKLREKYISLSKKETISEKERERLNKLSNRVYISRQEVLLSNIQHYVNEMTVDNDLFMEEILTGVFYTQELHQLYNMEQHIGFQVAYDKISESKLQTLVHTGWDGKNYSSKLWHNRDTLIQTLQRMIPRQFIMGASSQELAEELAKIMKVPLKNACNLIRTECTHLSAHADKRLYKETGIISYQFLATIDDRTTEDCIYLNGKHFDLCDARTGVNYPPIHYGCRSITIPDIDMRDYTKLHLAKDENGNYKRIPKMPFTEWENKRSVEVKSVSDSGKIKNYGVTDTADSNGHDSLSKYTDKSGNLTEERERLHKQIIDNFYKDVKPVSGQATFTIMGGGSASGKSTMIKSGAATLPKNSILVDSDKIKTMLPEYNEMLSKGDSRAANYVHEESSALAKRILRISNKENYNAVLDGTGNGSIESLTRKINNAKNAGMIVEGIYATVPTQIAVDRSAQRALKTGREVPPHVITNIHKKVSQILPQVAAQFDSVKLYDTTAGAKLIATGGNGSGLTAVKGQELLFKQFLEKGR